MSNKNDEYNRIIKLLEDVGVKDKKIKVLEPIIENVAWQKIKLDETRDAIKNSKVAISYDNGGGQKGIRENPLFKGYESLFKSYMSGMNKIIDAIPEEHVAVKVEEAEKPKTMLQLVRERKQA